MEYLLLPIEFFIIKGWKSLIYFLVPILIGLLIFYKADTNVYQKNAPNLHTDLVTVFCILIGFSISTLTMLLTVTNANIDEAKAQSVQKEFLSKKFTVFDTVLTGLAYIILIQGFLLTADFIWPAFVAIESVHGKMAFCINVALMVHVVLILMRNILDFYFMITKRK